MLQRRAPGAPSDASEAASQEVNGRALERPRGSGEPPYTGTGRSPDAEWIRVN
jgi:hypothetical protein